MVAFSTLRAHPALRQALTLRRELRRWPLRAALPGLRLRFNELRLGATAGSLTFTTVFALVPLAVLALSLFTAFPMFASFQRALEQYFLTNLVPDEIVKPVMRSLTQFAGKAKGLGLVGAGFLSLTALALLLTIDRTLNSIWRVRRPRPWAKRVLVYWAVLTLGPLVLGASLALTSYAISVGQGWVGQGGRGPWPGRVGWLIDAAQFTVLWCSVAALFHYVPNTSVRWRHAALGGGFVAVVFSLAKIALAWWLKQVPTYSTLYGAFATLPVLLMWIYLGWVIVLLGALLAANAPVWARGGLTRMGKPGRDFELCLAVLGELWRRQQRGAAGARKPALAARLQADELELEPVLALLEDLDWVAPLDEAGVPRWVLLRDPEATRLAPLLQRLLVEPQPATQAFWAASGWEALRLAEVLNRRA